MRIPTALAILLAAAGTATAQDDRIGARGRYWFAKLNGTLESRGSVLIPGSEIDVDQELGLNAAEEVPEIEGWIKIPVLGRFSASYWRSDFRGEDTLSRDITFQDFTFTTGTAVTTQLDLRLYSLSYEFVLPSVPLGGLVDLEIGLLGGVRILDAYGQIEGSGQDLSDSGTGGLPVLGVHATVLFAELVRVEAQLAGFAYRYSDTSTSFIDAFIEATFSFGPAFAGLGYRYVGIDIEKKDGGAEFGADLTIDGIYVTVGVRF